MRRWRRQAKLSTIDAVNAQRVLEYARENIQVAISESLTSGYNRISTPQSREELVPLVNEETQTRINDLLSRCHNDFVLDWVRLAHRSFQNQEEILRRLERIENGNIQGDQAKENIQSRFKELL